jgi:hypothetical protein
MITHLVMFKFKSADDAAEARERLLAMKGRISGMLDLEAGLDFIHSDRSYDLALITRHNQREDLEAYRVDPVHQEVVEFIKGRATGSCAVDFES